jgi:hypothetical protein
MIVQYLTAERGPAFDDKEARYPLKAKAGFYWQSRIRTPTLERRGGRNLDARYTPVRMPLDRGCPEGHAADPCGILTRIAVTRSRTSGDEITLVRRRHRRRSGGALSHASRGVPTDGSDEREAF